MTGLAEHSEEPSSGASTSVFHLDLESGQNGQTDTHGFSREAITPQDRFEVDSSTCVQRAPPGYLKRLVSHLLMPLHLGAAIYKTSKRLKPSSYIIPDERLEQLKVKPLEQYPPGYPQLSAFVDTDPDFRIYRRFGTIRHRVNLQKQYELAEMETELEKLDQKDYEDADMRFCLSSIKFDQKLNTERQILIGRIDKKLQEYDAFLEREQKSLSFSRPTWRNHISLINYIWNNKSIYKPEVELFNRIDDMIIFSSGEDSLLYSWLILFILRCNFRWLQKWFLTPIQKEKVQDNTIKLHSRERLEALSRFITSFMTVALVMVPVWILFVAHISDLARLFVVLLFVLFFHISLWIFSRAKSQEIIAATAAYTAVLVVFLQNVTTGVTSGDSGSTDVA